MYFPLQHSSFHVTTMANRCTSNLSFMLSRSVISNNLYLTQHKKHVFKYLNKSPPFDRCTDTVTRAKWAEEKKS